jgi:hypothetical protein
MNWFRRLLRFPPKAEVTPYIPERDRELMETRQRVALLKRDAERLLIEQRRNPPHQ